MARVSVVLVVLFPLEDEKNVDVNQLLAHCLTHSMGHAEWARQRIVPGPITPPQCDLSPSPERNAPLLLLPLRAARVRRAVLPE